MDGRTAALLTGSVEAAVTVARGGDPPPGFLADLRERLDADAGVGITEWEHPRPHVVRMDAATARVGPIFTAGELRRAVGLARTHPQLGPFLHGRVPAPRLSDLVDLHRFWDTEVWQVVHGVHDGRYPMGVVLSLDSRRVRFVGMQRLSRDFTDAEVDLAQRVLRPVAAAYTFRSRLEDVVESLPVPADGPASLTRRQQEVLGLVSRGRSDRQIAVVLGISERTVRKHVADARERTGTSNRAAAAVWWVHHR